MISNQIEVSAVLVTHRRHERQHQEAWRRHVYLDAQPEPEYKMEQFVVRKGLEAKSLADLKGKKHHVGARARQPHDRARAALANVGLKEGDYTIDQLDMGQHVNAMNAGTFDGGYTLEPNASTMRRSAPPTTLEAGVIAKYILGDPKPTPSSAARRSPPTSSKRARRRAGASPVLGARRLT